MKIHPDSLKEVPNGIKEFPSAFMSEVEAENFHMQSLERLNERGGMAYSEILANLFPNKKYTIFKRKDEAAAEKLLSHILQYLKD